MITFMILTTFIIHVVATYGIFLAAYMGADLTQVLSQGTAKTADEAKAICQALYDTM